MISKKFVDFIPITSFENLCIHFLPFTETRFLQDNRWSGWGRVFFTIFSEFYIFCSSDIELKYQSFMLTLKFSSRNENYLINSIIRSACGDEVDGLKHVFHGQKLIFFSTFLVTFIRQSRNIQLFKKGIDVLRS